ncbi:MAG: FHA domain-containing protein [Acidimicrobiales bacterium]
MGANFCASCGEPLEGSEPTSDHPVVQIDDVPGAVDVDRSAFGPHQGLFVVVHGAKAGARYSLDSDVITVGRHPRSEIFLDDITVSRRHAEVRREGSRYWVRDVGSLNGTYVNRELVDDVELHDGDEVQVGKFKLVFVHGTGEDRR